jgi:hypothetical protein
VGMRYYLVGMRYYTSVAPTSLCFLPCLYLLWCHEAFDCCQQLECWSTKRSDIHTYVCTYRRMYRSLHYIPNFDDGG